MTIHDPVIVLERSPLRPAAPFTVPLAWRAILFLVPSISDTDNSCHAMHDTGTVRMTSCGRLQEQAKLNFVVNVNWIEVES